MLENSPKLDEAILQSARFQDIRKQIRLGTITHKDANLTVMQIRQGLLDLLNEIEEQGKKASIGEELEQAEISIVNSKNVVAGNILAGGNVHIGENITNIAYHIQGKKEKKMGKAVWLTVMIAMLGVVIGFFGEWMPDDLKKLIEVGITNNLGISFLAFWLLAIAVLVLSFLWLTWKEALADDKETEYMGAINAKLFYAIRTSLITRYQERLDQKLAGRLPINLRRIDFTETVTQLSKKQFKEIALEDIETQLADFFKTAEGRLLIVGSPGAGKTTLLLQLALALLESQSDALPAVVNLSTWTSEFKSLEDWLKKVLPIELSLTKLPNEILDQNRVILLFDGLDEIADAEQRAKCLVAIDLFTSTTNPRREFVISSRKTEFLETAHVPIAFPIEIGQLTIEQIERELESQDLTQPGYRDLLADLKKDRLLLNAVETPFYFNCLQLLYAENKRPVFSADKIEGRKKEILDAYIENELSKCQEQEVRWWLAFLADRMSFRGLAEFELKNLQYNWWNWSLFTLIISGIMEFFVIWVSSFPIPFLLIGVFFAITPLYSLNITAQSVLMLSFFTLLLFTILGIMQGLMRQNSGIRTYNRIVKITDFTPTLKRFYALVFIGLMLIPRATMKLGNF